MGSLSISGFSAFSFESAFAFITGGIDDLLPLPAQCRLRCMFSVSQAALHDFSLQILPDVQDHHVPLGSPFAQDQYEPLWSTFAQSNLNRSGPFCWLALHASQASSRTTQIISLKSMSQHSDFGRATVHHQQRYIAGWGVLGSILAEYGASPQSVMPCKPYT